ncbi:zinc finger CCHC domain-containing protein 9-like [Saccostrea echinata]|uniref:zinc finger CCHC domain-containing protein 9-like n=1 Tax=Saccostrea echinata TaxID=191078 RepID=UPI002A81164A|nr:zinc finger CCHC domain-containing protein 9-like [Saccostrea echinata]
MTRFARASDGNRKRPLDATEWNEMKESRKKHKTDKNLKKKVDQNDGGKKSKHDKTKTMKSKQDDDHKKRKGKSKKKKQNDSLRSDNEKESTCQQTSLESRLRNLSQVTTQDLQLKEAYKKVKRSENRRLQRIQKRQDETICYNCRESGHQMSDCPEVKRDVEQGTGICFKCGSTEHSSSKCSVRLPPGRFPYAKCFICGETGHLSKQCPDNPKGLYPMGGCCKICESVEHYQRDCPELQSQQGVKSYCLPTIGGAHSSVDAEIDLEEFKPMPPVKKKNGPKTVVF